MIIARYFVLRSISRSREGAWIEIVAAAAAWRKPFVAPVRERGLKYLSAAIPFGIVYVAPVRERGLKSQLQ